MTRRAPVALALAALVALAVPSVAAAHATLEATTPVRGAHLEHAPGQVVLRFDESVTVSLGAVKVFDAKGHEVQQGATFHPGGTGAKIAVRLRPGLPMGGRRRSPAGR